MHIGVRDIVHIVSMMRETSEAIAAQVNNQRVVRGKITKGDQSPMIEESKEMMMNRKLLDAGDQHSEKEEEEEEEE